MADLDFASASTVERPSDIGKGPAGVAKRWKQELELADKRERAWRKEGWQTVRQHRDENERAAPVVRRGGGSKFNILWSNTELLRPSLYSRSPRPDVRRRYRDRNPLAKAVAELIERGLAYSIDSYDFDHALDLSVLDYLLVGRGLVRVRYLPYNEPGKDGDEIKQWEAVECEHVEWDSIRIGPAGKWADLPWLAFRHSMTRDELVEAFGAEGRKVELDTELDRQDGKGRKDEDVDLFRRATVYEIWSKETREVIWVAPHHDDRPLKVEPDPLSLRDFWPVPRPLYAVESSSTLVPVEEYRLYRDQAEELNRITQRIQRIISGLKLRGVYDSTIAEMDQIFREDDNALIPASGAAAFMNQPGGLDKAVWMMPIERAAQVLASLYTQREAIKQTIYEITGLSDILRGSTDPNETLGAQQLKAQTGSLRLQKRQREVQRFIRDVVRIKAEIMAEQFDPVTWQVMTGLEVTDEMLQLMRDDGQRGFVIDIETDSTVIPDQQADQEQITALLQGITQFIVGIGPAVAAGHIPKELAGKMLLPAVRRFRLGREVEDAIEQIAGSGGDEDGTITLSQEQAAQMRQQIEQQAMMQAQAQAEQALVGEKQAVAGEKAQVDVEKQRVAMEQKAMQGAVAQAKAELAVQERALQVALREAGLDVREKNHGVDKAQLELSRIGQEMTSKALELDDREAATAATETEQESVDEAQRAISEATAEMVRAVGEMQAQHREQTEAIIAALTAPRTLIRDARGRPAGVRAQVDAGDGSSPLLDALAAPREIVRDAQGRPAGTKVKFDA